MFWLIFFSEFVCLSLATTPDKPLHGEQKPTTAVSGLRIQNIGERGFYGYTEAWETVVEPNIEVRVVIFGFLLDKVEYLIVTDQTCTDPEFNITREGFLFQSPLRIEFKFKFPLWDKPWRFCIKHEGGDLRLIDDDRTWITTEIVHKRDDWLPMEIRYVIILFLLCLSGLCSGLNLGLMNLSTQELNLIINSGSETEIRYAKSILPIRQKGNYLLCAILLTNVVVNSAISILTEDLWAGVIALVVSSAGIVLFGEIIPQSICYKFALAVGAKTVWITKTLMVLTFPLAYPISVVLNVVLGETVDQFPRNRLVELLRMTAEQQTVGGSEFAEDLKIVMGAMEFSAKMARNAMTRIEDVFMISADEILNSQLIAEIVKKGYSRIPIYYENDRNKIRSLLHVRDLVIFDKSHESTAGTVAQYFARQLRMVDEKTTLAILLEEFKRGDYHLALVYKSQLGKSISFDLEYASDAPLLSTSSKGEDIVKEVITENLEPIDPQFIGLITLEDIIEEILQSEILDEYDIVTDNVMRAKRQTSQGKITELFCCEKKASPLPNSILKVANTFLEDHCILFENSYMNPMARENMIQKNIRKVILVPRERGEQPRIIRLIERGVKSCRMLLLIEGRAKVIFKSNMQFTVDPWTFFGDPLLEKIMQARQEKRAIQSYLSYTPDFDLIADEPCQFLQITVSTLLYTLKISNIMKRSRSIMEDSHALKFEEDVPAILRSRKQRTSSFQDRHSLDEGLVKLLIDDKHRSVSFVAMPNRPSVSSTITE